MRLFIAIDLTNETKQFLSKINTEISEIQGIKTVNAENLHLTLLFLGEKNPNETIKTLKELKFKSFELELSKFGFFPNRSHIKTLWFGVEKKQELIMMQEKIAKKFKKQQEYKPHITYARIKHTNSTQRKKIFKTIEKFKTKKLKMCVNKIRIYSSELTPLGPIHRVIDTINAS
ncbi:RNA 2',3'-cyclic phosphodiesterase [Candidatus Woesearchaeota archaeon]|nr:RNA 2',3'-cyclic phosphodiesterase [Candidatus Woesearchaeota archaeon]